MVGQQSLRFESPWHRHARGENLRLGRPAVVVPVLQLVNPTQHTLDIEVVRKRRLTDGFVVDGEVIHHVLWGIAVHPVQPVPHDQA